MSVTNQAVVDAALDRTPRSALDIGCGEGWLARVLSGNGVRVLGVDVVPQLIAEARRISGGEFRIASYEMNAAGQLELAGGTGRTFVTADSSTGGIPLRAFVLSDRSAQLVNSRRASSHR